MGFFEEYDISVMKNEMEDAVFRELYKYIEKRKKDPSFPQFCICQTCILDISAIALNHLQPHYQMVSTDTPHAIEYSSYIDFAQINTELLKAIKIVMATPHHY